MGPEHAVMLRPAAPSGGAVLFMALPRPKPPLPKSQGAAQPPQARQWYQERSAWEASPSPGPPNRHHEVPGCTVGTRPHGKLLHNCGRKGASGRKGGHRAQPWRGKAAWASRGGHQGNAARQAPSRADGCQSGNAPGTCGRNRGRQRRAPRTSVALFRRAAAMPPTPGCARKRSVVLHVRGHGRVGISRGGKTPRIGAVHNPRPCHRPSSKDAPRGHARQRRGNMRHCSGASRKTSACGRSARNALPAAPLSKLPPAMSACMRIRATYCLCNRRKGPHDTADGIDGHNPHACDRTRSCTKAKDLCNADASQPNGTSALPLLHSGNLPSCHNHNCHPRRRAHGGKGRILRRGKGARKRVRRNSRAGRMSCRIRKQIGHNHPLAPRHRNGTAA
mmetsp:Transcript_15546/g.32906  ORF Transcript_15546/g.32906 Transcript_15546/m.32906 type:complete len:391 (-) Transcript_15546:998-2170(-)